MTTKAKTGTVAKALAEDLDDEPIVVPVKPEVPKKKGPIRTAKAAGNITEADYWLDTDLVLPAGLNEEVFGPASFFSEPVGVPKRDQEQQYRIDLAKLGGITFDATPGRALRKEKRLKVMKAFNPGGSLVQLPLSKNINNAAAGRDSDRLGLLTYTDKGFLLCQDPQRYPFYCYAIDCWAAAMRKVLSERYPEHIDVIGTGYCTKRHYDHTEPNRGPGLFGVGATTAAVYNG